MILCREGIFYHFHNVMYTPFLSVDETNNDRAIEEEVFFNPVARWKSNKSIKALPIQTDGNIGSPLSHISLLVRKNIYNRIKIDGKMYTNILQRDSYIYIIIVYSKTQICDSNIR